MGQAGSVAPDGGFESEAAVRDRLAEGYAFELAYESDGEEQIQLVTHEGFDRPAAKPIRGPPAFRFASVGGDQTMTLRLPEVVSLYTVSVADLAGPLREDLVRSMAEDVSSDPESVPLDDVEETLQLAVEGDLDAQLGVSRSSAEPDSVLAAKPPGIRRASGSRCRCSTSRFE